MHYSSEYLDITIASSALAGVSQSGNIATVTLQLANGAEPAAKAFSVTNIRILDISSMLGKIRQA
ncbi:hypothetical protein GMST_12700 [Geomonas silvestris]|uniref:Uncharacterized protein n=1 Tax=Geomonas silvestris TaxID=2740184 RepID=A0A6V8MG47_9BACT|nr:hypothetical protein [Geomonas silvestris]GFO58945.1 hypothetical protein GMST_12700 [Geomonas silvestris]